MKNKGKLVDFQVVGTRKLGRGGLWRACCRRYFQRV